MTNEEIRRELKLCDTNSNRKRHTQRKELLQLIFYSVILLTITAFLLIL